MTLCTGILTFLLRFGWLCLPGQGIESPAKGDAVLQARQFVQSDVLDAWMKMQIQLMAGTLASFNGPFIRIYAYSGVAAYASVYPWTPKETAGWFPLQKLQDFPELPVIDPQKNYYAPASLNAALGWMNRAMFINADEKGRLAIQQLKDSIHAICVRQVGIEAAGISANYGQETAQRIYFWSENDGHRSGSKPYAAPTAKGNWKPTAPEFAKPVSPYWGGLRTIVKGSIDAAEPPPPPAYSEDTSTAFYQMVNEVYVISKELTEDQKAIARYWKDVNPGVTATGHWLNIMRKVCKEDRHSLEQGALAYALTGIALNDTWISSWKTRYTYNVQRPITYIQEVMGHKEWQPTIQTPPHPEYPGGHAALSSSVAEILTILFGAQRKVTDDTYIFLGMPARNYLSFRDIAEEAAISKVYGGIHYRLSVNVGLQQGQQVARSVAEQLQLNRGRGAGHSDRVSADIKNLKK